VQRVGFAVMFETDGSHWLAFSALLRER